MTTKSKQAHAPTPWKADYNVHSGKSAIRIKDKKAQLLAITTPENAFFVVQACNSHEELLEALREIQKLYNPDTQAWKIADKAIANATKNDPT